MLSSARSKPWSLIALTLLQGLRFGSAATNIAADCFPNSAEIASALQEAQSIADYASKRWSVLQSPRKGNLMMDMLGAPNEDDQGTFDYAKRTYLCKGNNLMLEIR